MILDYTSFHFADEEKLLASRGYPKTEAHKALHLRFVEEFMALKRKINDEGVTAAAAARGRSSPAPRWRRFPNGRLTRRRGHRR